MLAISDLDPHIRRHTQRPQSAALSSRWRGVDAWKPRDRTTGAGTSRSLASTHTARDPPPALPTLRPGSAAGRGLNRMFWRPDAPPDDKSLPSRPVSAPAVRTAPTVPRPKSAITHRPSRSTRPPSAAASSMRAVQISMDTLTCINEDALLAWVRLHLPLLTCPQLNACSGVTRVHSFASTLMDDGVVLAHVVNRMLPGDWVSVLADSERGGGSAHLHNYSLLISVLKQALAPVIGELQCELPEATSVSIQSPSFRAHVTFVALLASLAAPSVPVSFVNSYRLTLSSVHLSALEASVHDHGNAVLAGRVPSRPAVGRSKHMQQIRREEIEGKVVEIQLFEARGLRIGAGEMECEAQVVARLTGLRSGRASSTVVTPIHEEQCMVFLCIQTFSAILWRWEACRLALKLGEGDLARSLVVSAFDRSFDRSGPLGTVTVSLADVGEHSRPHWYKLRRPVSVQGGAVAPGTGSLLMGICICDPEEARDAVPAEVIEGHYEERWREEQKAERERELFGDEDGEWKRSLADDVAREVAQMIESREKDEREHEARVEDASSVEHEDGLRKGDLAMDDKRSQQDVEEKVEVVDVDRDVADEDVKQDVEDEVGMVDVDRNVPEEVVEGEIQGEAPDMAEDDSLAFLRSREDLESFLSELLGEDVLTIVFEDAPEGVSVRARVQIGLYATVVDICRHHGVGDMVWLCREVARGLSGVSNEQMRCVMEWSCQPCRFLRVCVVDSCICLSHTTDWHMGLKLMDPRFQSADVVPVELHVVVLDRDCPIERFKSL